ncbi:hypothetical protein H0E84_17300 [Luteimonas sp. SJ-92]|uniref:Uncharacterized protein n=1 Tax=Luteimonas salinisoli TaxID=2752307 RepID=A0A853JI78_9GAMM|nr:hypothetical protein [Luteimonas salinisoli]NZA28138.1 hypothetical protein [Luteimonas salinisoli]
MDFYGIDRDKTIANCDSLALGLAGRGTESVCAWNRIRPEHVVDLLDNAAADARGDARDLATLLSRFTWRIRGGASAQGSSNRLVNNVREITVSAAGRNFQLHCVETPSLKLERITA